MQIVCKHCGRPESEHHEFVAEMPKGCVCVPATWLDVVEPACQEYVGDGTQYCTRCAHDKACHKPKEATCRA